MSDGAGAVLFSTDEVEVQVKDGVATIANQAGFVGVGFDGSNYRFVKTNASGQQVAVGAGVAGTPSGGVVSIQGVVSGTVVPISVGTLPLPSGAATEVTLATLLTEAAFTARIPVNGQALMAASVPVVISSDQSVLSVDDNGGSITIDTTQLPAALVGGRLDSNIGAWLGSTAPTVGQKTMASSVPVAFASDQSPLTVQQGTPPWAIKGTDADGVAPTESPVLVAGWDGTNVQQFRTNSSGRQQQVLYADNGNPVAIVLDNSVYRLEARATLVGQALGTGAEKKITSIDDTDVAGEIRLQTEARLAPGSAVNIGTGIPADPAALDISFLMNGGSEDMLVDGSGTAKVFAYGPGAGVKLAVQSLLVVFTADDFDFDGVSFGPNSALANGIVFETDIGGAVIEIFNIKQNEDFLRIPGRIPLVNNTGPKDVLSASFQFGGLVKLDGDLGDQMLATVRDNLTGVKLKYLTATIYGAEV